MTIKKTLESFDEKYPCAGWDAHQTEEIKDFIKESIIQAIDERDKEIAVMMRSFPLSDQKGVEFVFNEDNWKAGYAALDAFADYLERK